MLNEDKKQMAYMMYVEQGMNAGEVTKILGIARNTMWRWCKNGDWAYQRRQRKISPTRLTTYFYELTEMIARQAIDAGEGLNSKPAGALSKMAVAIQKMDRKTDPRQFMMIFMQFNTFLVKQNRNLALQLIPYEKKFIGHLLGTEVGSPHIGEDTLLQPIDNQQTALAIKTESTHTPSVNC